ncbi:MAG: hypothetical protein ACOYWZ_21490 [Bacillota bacterium]
MNNSTLLDILLFPKTFYKKLSDKLLSLYLGIIVIGLIDTGMILGTRMSDFFLGKPHVVLVFNISLALCFVVLIGLMDVVFFSLPLFDIFKFFRLKERIKNINGQLIKLMKIYMVSRFYVVPIGVVLRLLAGGPLGGSSFIYMWLVLDILLIVWQSAIIARGVNTIYSFDDRLRSLVFVIAYTWLTLLGFAVVFIVNNWLLKLFK